MKKLHLVSVCPTVCTWGVVDVYSLDVFLCCSIFFAIYCIMLMDTLSCSVNFASYPVNVEFGSANDSFSAESFATMSRLVVVTFSILSRAVLILTAESFLWKMDFPVASCCCSHMS